MRIVLVLLKVELYFVCRVIMEGRCRIYDNDKFEFVEVFFLWIERMCSENMKGKLRESE